MARLRLFASAREAAGTGRDVVEGATVADVLAAAAVRYGQAFSVVLPACRIWVNGEPAEPSTSVDATDEVALLPPVSGGSGDVRYDVEERLAELGGFIRNQREVTRLSVRRLAELADVSNPYLSQIERGLRKPSAAVLQQIAKALQISAESLYVRAGILDPDHDVVPSVVEAVHRDPFLDAEQKRTLLRVYESLRAQAAAADH